MATTPFLVVIASVVAGEVRSAAFEAIARRTIRTSGAEINLVHKGEGPPLVLWSARAGFGLHYDVLATWRARALDVRGQASSCGHFLPEEAPEETLAELERFFAG